MTSQVSAIILGALVGTIAAPLVWAAWKKMAPPPPSTKLSNDDQKFCERIEREAAWVPFAIFAFFGIFLGLNASIKGPLGVFMISTVVLGYIAWIAFRVRLRGARMVHEYRSYVSSTHKISLRSIEIVTAILFVLAIVTFVLWLSGEVGVGGNAVT